MIPLQNEQLIIWDDRKKQLLKDTICKTFTDDEFELFLHVCKRTQLDPFIKQIHAVPRWDNTLKRNVMIIQTGIDGYRLIAERTRAYAPGQKPTFTLAADGSIIAATAYVKKLTADNTWHVVEAEAYWDEYVQCNKEGRPTAMWVKMPHNQLAKCAEALALRKAFPAELSGIYTREEMEQAEVVEVDSQVTPEKKQVDMTPISEEQLRNLNFYIDNDGEYLKSVMERLAKLKITRLQDIPAVMYHKVLEDAKGNYKKNEDQLIYQQRLERET